MYKITFYVTKNYLEKVKEAMFNCGGGEYNSYRKCSWQTKGEGQFLALKGSNPHIGSVGNLKKVEEFKVEMICQKKAVKKVVEALLENHPYETPAYDVTKILTKKDILSL